jgi:hypothetical protein
MNRSVLFSVSADDVVTKAPAVYPARLARLQDFKARGELLMVGTFANLQADGSMAIFRSPQDAEEFATEDLFVPQASSAAGRSRSGSSHPRRSERRLRAPVSCLRRRP